MWTENIVYVGIATPEKSDMNIMHVLHLLVMQRTWTLGKVVRKQNLLITTSSQTFWVGTSQLGVPNDGNLAANGGVHCCRQGRLAWRASETKCWGKGHRGLQRRSPR